MIKSLCFSFIVISLIITSGTAQQATSTSAGDVSNLNGSLSYTIGQPFFDVGSSQDGIVQQGIQNVYIISSTLDTDELNLRYDFTVYPNPAQDVFQLKLKSVPADAELLLIDSLGKVVLKKEVTQNITEVNLTNLVPSLYFAKLRSSSSIISTFKIIKK